MKNLQTENVPERSRREVETICISLSPRLEGQTANTENQNYWDRGQAVTGGSRQFLERLAVS